MLTVYCRIYDSIYLQYIFNTILWKWFNYTDDLLKVSEALNNYVFFLFGRVFGKGYTATAQYEYYNNTNVLIKD